MISELWENIRYALRRIRMAPAFAALVVLTMAVGIGATTAIFSVVNAVVLRPIPIPEADRVVRIYEVNPSKLDWTTSEPNFLDFRDATRSYTAVAAVTGRSASLLGHGDPVALSGLAATASYFSLFGERSVAGAPFGVDHDRPAGDTHVVVISEGVWRRIFGADPTLIGKNIDLDGAPYQVLGVMPQGYGYLPSDFWVPLAPDRASNRGNHLLTSFGRLKPAITIAAANAEAVAVAAQLARLYPKSNASWTARVESFADFIVGPTLRQQLLMLFGAVGFLLLLASANVANLLLARSSTRMREIAVRSALGASTSRITRQLLTESTVLSLGGALFGIALAWVAVPLLRQANSVNVPRLDEVGIDSRVLLFAIGVALVTGLLFGLAPSGHALRADLQAALREGSRSVAGSGRRARDLLVTVEVALAVVLLVGAGLIGRSFVRLGQVEPGFSLGGVLQLTVTAPNDLPRDRRASYFRQIEDAIATVPGVMSVGASSVAPFSGNNTQTQFLPEGSDKTTDYVPADWRSVSPGFFKTLGVPLVRGRLLEPTDIAGHPSVAVIDQSMAARIWPGQDPLGKHLVPAQSARGPADAIEVVGVVKDIRDQSPATNPGPAIYLPEAQKPWIQLTFYVRGRARGPSAALIDGIRRAVRDAAPGLPVPDVTPLATNVNQALAPQRFTAGLLGVFALAALLLAAIGIYGVISFNVAQRAPEMGVRLAFGASPARVAGGVIRDSALLVGGGAIVGCLAAAALARLITSLLFATDTWDAPTYLAVVLTLLAVAAAAACFPARRAARTDPAIVLREV